MAKEPTVQEASSRGYPKPGPMGGTLMRRLVATLKEAGFELPISSYILIACSGGADSVALASLLARYGRRVGERNRIGLLHINHGWRGEESDGDARFVKALAEKLGLELLDVDARAEVPGKGESWEDHARRIRQKIFQELALSRKALIFTAHHGDDLAETLLWRLLTGSADSHGGGIALRDGPMVRPLLRIRKSELLSYLSEEVQDYRVDRTNDEGRFLRSRMRQELMPVIEELFPRGIERLIEAGLEAQEASVADGEMAEASQAEAAIRGLFQATGLRLRRAHWESVLKGHERGGGREVHLPRGWKLTHEKRGNRWILEPLRRLNQD